MPISKDEFQTINEDGPMLDLAPDTTQGTVYRFLLANADKAFRQREIIDNVDVPQGSVGPTLQRLEQHEVVDHRGHYWKIDDAEHAVASAAHLSATTVDEIDGGFSDGEVEAWMETAIDPIEETDESEDT